MDKVLNEFDNVSRLLQIISDSIPEGTEQKFEVNGVQLELTKKDGNIKIKVSQNLEEQIFDDTKVKELVEDFKEALEELDDETFIEVTEEAEKHFDIKKLDKLLKLEHFTEDEAESINSLISLFSQIICANLQDKIENLVDLYTRF